MEKWPKCKNDQHSDTFGGFLRVGASSGGSWRLPWKDFWIHFGRQWLQDGVFWILLRDVATSWRQDGEQECQVGGCIVLLEGGGSPPPPPPSLGTPGEGFGRGKDSHEKDYTGNQSWKSILEIMFWKGYRNTSNWKE